MNNAIGIIIALGVIVGGGWMFMQSQSASDTQNTQAVTQQDDVMVKDQVEDVMVKEEGEVMEKMEKEDAMMKKDGDSMEKMEKHEGDSMEKMEKEDVMMKKEDVMQKAEETEEAPVSQAPGSFRAYSSSAVAAAEGDVVIGFFADWCPSCRALKSDINSDLSAIPSGLTILDANYDSEKDLKKKYGVTTQHTLVQVDLSGNKVQSWRGGNTLGSIVAKVQ